MSDAIELGAAGAPLGGDREVAPTRGQPEANETVAPSRGGDRLENDGAQRRSVGARWWLVPNYLRVSR